MDLLDLWRDNDRLSWRKLGVLISQLPPESATATALRLDPREVIAEDAPLHDPETEQWSRVEQLLAGVRDEVLALRWVYSSVHSKAPLKWKPDPLARPGVTPKGKRAQTDNKQAELLWAHLNRAQGYGQDN